MQIVGEKVQMGRNSSQGNVSKFEIYHGKGKRSKKLKNLDSVLGGIFEILRRLTA